MIYKVVNKFLWKKVETLPPQTSEAKKCLLYHKLPFINNVMTLNIKKELNRIASRYFPQIDFRLVFFNNFTMRGILNHKERLPDALCSDICYLYLCDACGATYVGCSKRCLKTRSGEHFGISARTGNLLARPTRSAIRNHIEICGSSRSVDNFKVLRSFSNPVLLKIYESLEISVNIPCLNQDESSYPLLLT